MFRKKQTQTPEVYVTTQPVVFPNGICVQTEAGRFMLVGNLRYRITSDQVFDSWEFPRVAHATEAALKNYKVYRSLGFRNGTVIRSMDDGMHYFIVDAKKQRIANPDVFKRLNMRPEDAILASVEDARRHETKEEDLI